VRTVARIAVLCGTGMSAFASELVSMRGANSETMRIDSDWGQVPATLVSISEGEILVIDRHHSGDGSRTPPHMIEHRANIHAAASCQPDLVVSINSVGTMRENMPPGTIAVAGDVLDLAERPWTFHDDDASHADRTSPFDSTASETCVRAIGTSQGFALSGIVVAQCIGPQFESPSEIDALERLGADVVGMTLGPESRLMSERGIPHVALSCCSNWAAGRTPGSPDSAIDHELVDAVAATMSERVGDCMMTLLAELGD
tara:strand:- start:371 stop:1144 length:774 start_codon:yes stop_codon:yes gene_type:complete